MKTIIISLKLFLALTIVTCVIYPLVVTGAAQLLFPEKANGSFIISNGKNAGSELIGQQFTKPENFWGRPSAVNNNPMPSGGSNLNPQGETLKLLVNQRADTIRKYTGNIPLNSIPKDLLFASGSGVDPHISPEAAYFQIDRIVKYRNFNSFQKKELKQLVDKSIEQPDFNILGEPRVNVLKLNLALKNIK